MRRLFLCWFHRVRVNAEVFSPFGHAKKRGWAIGAWFVPIVNLWFPRRIALDIWDASSPWDAPRSHGLVDAWWTLWLLSVLTNRAGSFAYSSSDTAEEIRGAVRQVLVADVVDAVAAVRDPRGAAADPHAARKVASGTGYGRLLSGPRTVRYSGRRVGAGEAEEVRAVRARRFSRRRLTLGSRRIGDGVAAARRMNPASRFRGRR